MAVGSAPIQSKVVDFIKVTFSTQFINGYGQTEGIGMQFATFKEDINQEQVGGPFGHNEFKLVDVPELGYTHTNQRDNQSVP